MRQDKLTGLLSLSVSRTREDYVTLAKMTSVLRDDDANVGSWGPRDAAELDAMLAEYHSLRQETLNSITNRTQILIVGFAGIGALAGIAATTRVSEMPGLMVGIFSGAIPLACVFVFLLWLSEAVRAHRAGYFIASVVEAGINAKLGRLVVTWEAGLWTRLFPRDELWGPSMMALGVIGVLGVAAPWAGVLVVGIPIGASGPPLLEVWVPYSLFGLIVAYALHSMKRLRNIPKVSSAMHDVRTSEPAVLPKPDDPDASKVASPSQ